MPSHTEGARRLEAHARPALPAQRLLGRAAAGAPPVHVLERGRAPGDVVPAATRPWIVRIAVRLARLFLLLDARTALRGRDMGGW